MVAAFASSSVCVFACSFLAAGAHADETCMLQHPSVSTVIEREFPQAEEVKRSLDSLSRGETRQALTLLETESSVGSQGQESFVNFHNPRVWGPTGWFFFHTIALAQADEIGAQQQERLRRFFTEDMPHILPCPTCGLHAQQHIAAMDIDNTTFASRDSVAHFVWDLHDTVNAEKLGRGEDVASVSFERHVLNYAKAFDEGVTLLHFNNSDLESKAVSPQERRKVELLMAGAPPAKPSTSQLDGLSRLVTAGWGPATKLLRFFSSYLS